TSSSPGWCSVLLHQLHVEVDLHLVSDQHSPGFQRLVPGKSEIPTVDLRGGGKAHPLTSPWIAPGSFIRRIELDLAGRAPDRQVPDDSETVTRLPEAPVHATAAEIQVRMVLYVQEITRAEVVVPLLCRSVDARRADLHVGVPTPLSGSHHLPLYLSEPALHRRDHHMLHGELHRGVRRVDHPRAHRGPCLRVHCAHDLRDSPVGLFIAGAVGARLDRRHPPIRTSKPPGGSGTRTPQKVLVLRYRSRPRTSRVGGAVDAQAYDLARPGVRNNFRGAIPNEQEKGGRDVKAAQNAGDPFGRA